MSKQNTQINPPSRNVADMLEILANPDQYRQHLAELKTSHRELEERIGVYNSLEKVRAFDKQVKLDAAEVSKSRVAAEALWTKLEQSSKDLSASKDAFAAHQAELEQEHAYKLAAHARDLSAHLANVHAYEQDVANLAQDRMKLRADQARHDARMTAAKDKLAAVVDAIKGVEAL